MCHRLSVCFSFCLKPHRNERKRRSRNGTAKSLSQLLKQRSAGDDKTQKQRSRQTENEHRDREKDRQRHRGPAYQLNTKTGICCWRLFLFKEIIFFKADRRSSSRCTYTWCCSKAAREGRTAARRAAGGQDRKQRQRSRSAAFIQRADRSTVRCCCCFCCLHKKQQLNRDTKAAPRITKDSNNLNK